MGTKSFNASNAAGISLADILLLLTLDSDSSSANPTDLSSSASGPSLQSPASQPNVNVSGQGWGIQITPNGTFSEFGINLATPFTFNTGPPAQAWSVFLAGEFISTGAAHGSTIMLSQSQTVAGSSIPFIGFKNSAGAFTPLLIAGSTTEVTGTSIGASTAFSAAATGAYGTANTWTLYTNGGSPLTAAVTNVGASNTIGRVGGQDGQGSVTFAITYLVVFNIELTSGQISTLHGSLAGGGAFDLVTISGGGGSGSVLLLDSTIDGGMSTMDGGMTCRSRTSPRIFLPPRNILVPAHL